MFFFSLQATQRSPNSKGQQPKTQGLPQTRARTGAPPTDARSESGKRQQRRQRLARTEEANATTHRRPHTARLPLAEPNTGRARDMHCTREGTEAENGQSARGGTVQTGPHGRKWHEAENGCRTARRAHNTPKGSKRTGAQLKQHYRGASPTWWVNGLRAPGGGNRAWDARQHPTQQPTPGPSAKRLDHTHGSQTPPLRAPAESHLPNLVANVAQALNKGKRAAAPSGHDEAGQGAGKDTRREEGKDPRHQPPRSSTDPKRAARLPRGTRVVEADEKTGKAPNSRKTRKTARRTGMKNARRTGKGGRKASETSEPYKHRKTISERYEKEEPECTDSETEC